MTTGDKTELDYLAEIARWARLAALAGIALPQAQGVARREVTGR